MINYAIDYGSAVQEAFGGKRYSDKLWNPSSNGSVKFVSASHVRVPKITVTSGRTYRNRRDMTVGELNNWSNDYTDYELKFDREWETLVDPRDVKDTDGAATIATITSAYNKQQKMPEMDKYMFSKLYKEKVKLDGSNGIHSVVLDESNILQTFDKMLKEMKENEVDSDLTLYITVDANDMLKRAVAPNRTITVDGANGDLNRIVRSLDKVQIVEVPSKRMKTDFDFTVGAKDKAGSQQIEMFLIADGIHVAPDQYDFVGFQEPTALTKGNYLYYESEFSDVLMIDGLQAGYEAVVAPNKAQNVVEQPAQPKADDSKDKKQEQSK